MLRVLLIPALAALAALACSCAPLENMRAKEWRWEAAEPAGAAGAAAGASLPRVRVLVAPEFRELMQRLEPRYEAEAQVDLELVFGAALDVRGAEDQLILTTARAGAGRGPDLLLLE